MASRSLRRFVGASINADDLFERYKVACTLKQDVDRGKIIEALRRWTSAIGIAEVQLLFVDSAAEIEKAAQDARAAWAAWAARTAWDAWAAWDARAAFATRDARDAQAAWNARDARAARTAWDARAAWDARGAWAAWAARDLSYESAIAIGASSLGEQETLQKWLGLFEAFEAGAFCLWIVADTIYVAVIPTKVLVDDRRRLHCADEPAFVWLNDVRDFYWHGVHVPDYVIERPSEILVETIDAVKNTEVRRVMIERYRFGEEIHGAGAFMRDAGGKSLDHDEQYGTLWRREIKGDEPIVILEVINSTREPDGRFKHYWLRVPATIKTAHEASAWTFDIPAEKYAPQIET